ncbi:CCA tRNA nucleotidyltransferase [Algoriphagus namhaensis]
MNFSEHLNQNDIFRRVAEASAHLGLRSYVVGGYVRDLVLGRSSKDIDFMCEGSGIELAKAVAASYDSHVPLSIFKNFGTAMLKLEEGEIEFVGARKESYQRDSRKPIVEDGTFREDIERRDFTINAMAISLSKENYGDLIDSFGGVKDIQKKMIRTPLDPEITFSDDPLRMMRAIRFASQLEFDIDADTFHAISTHASRLQIISMERVIVELNKIILSPKPSYGFKLLFASKLLHEFFPEMVDLQGVDSVDDKSHKDNFYHTLQVLDNVCQTTDNLWLRWAAIMHDIAKPATKRFNKKVGWTFHGHEDKGARMTPAIFKRLKLPLDERMKYVQKLVRLHLRPIALVKDEVTDSALRRLLMDAGDDIDDLMKLCRADVTSKNNRKVKRYLENFDKVERKLAEVEEKDHLRNFQPPISGEEIMNSLDLKPSKAVGEIKEEIKEAILEGKIENEHQQAKELMFIIAQKKGILPK